MEVGAQDGRAAQPDCTSYIDREKEEEECTNNEAKITTQGSLFQRSLLDCLDSTFHHADGGRNKGSSSPLPTHSSSVKLSPLKTLEKVVAPLLVVSSCPHTRKSHPLFRARQRCLSNRYPNGQHHLLGHHVTNLYIANYTDKRGRRLLSGLW